MSDQGKVVVVAVHADLVSARRDLQALQDFYYETNDMAALDVALVGKQDSGKVKIFRKYAGPTAYAEVLGPGWGLATALAVAVYPGAPYGSGFLAGDSPSAGGVSVVAAHVARALDRSALCAIGGLLDSTAAGLIVVTRADLATQVERAMAEAERVSLWTFAVDEKALQGDLRDAIRPMTA